MYKDPKQILENLSNLRFFQGDESEFIKNYLDSITLLSKSEVSIFLSFKDDKISIIEETKKDNISDEFVDDFLNNSIECIKRAKKSIYSYEKFNSYFIVSISQKSLDDNISYSLLLLVKSKDKVELSNTILKLSLCRDIFLDYQLKKNNGVVDNSKNNDIEYSFKEILIILNSIVYEKKFKLATMKIVDEFINRFDVNRVSIGWKNKDYIKPISISHVDSFLKNSPLSKSLEAIFEESCEQNGEIFYPDDENSTLITVSHKLYLVENKLSSLYTFPIRVDGDIVGAISFEKQNGFLSNEELELIRITLNYIAPTLNNIYKKDRNIFVKFLDNIVEFLKYIVGPKDVFKKFFSLILTILFLWSIFAKIDYNIDATVSLKTDNISYLSAPFNSIVKEVFFDIGDSVKKGDVLVLFDDKEFLLKKNEVSSDIVRYSTEMEKARSSRVLADMKIAKAKKEQAMAKLEKIDYFLSKTKVISPFDGVVIEGDKEELIGKPFSKGDIIMKIANISGIYAMLKISEEYIDDIKNNQKVLIRLLSRPDVTFEAKIEKIVPVAKVENGKNLFLIKGLFISDIEKWMRPGMGGVGKINIGKKRVIWIITHKLIDFIYLHIW